MSDCRPTVDQPSTDRPPIVDRLMVVEAAARLGISSDAVRSRLNRGTLEGRKEEDGWVVYLPVEPTVDQPSPAVERPSTDREPTVAPDALLTSKDETITALRDEVAFLRRELETRTDELQRRDVLLREALERIPQLPANVAPPSQAAPAAHHAPDDDDEDDLVLTADRPLRGPSAPIGPPAWRTSERVEAERLPWWRRWWERWQ